jgi:hypothetical protein
MQVLYWQMILQSDIPGCSVHAGMVWIKAAVWWMLSTVQNIPAA